MPLISIVVAQNRLLNADAMAFEIENAEVEAAS
jgi:hypothetical protein